MASDIKSYLVKLGWNVDELGYNNATSKVKNFASTVADMGGSTVSNFAKASVAVTSFLATVNLGMAKLLTSTAEADLAVEKFARQMWTTEEAARSFTSALDAMDADYDDIFYMTAEQYQRFMDLKNLGNEMEAPDGLQKSLLSIRDLMHQFDRLKVIANYATQWVSYYITKYIGDDIENVTEMFANFNDFLQNKIPKASEKLAKFFVITYKLGKAAVTFIYDVASGVVKLWNSFDSGAKNAVLAISAVGAAMMMSPLGWFIAGLTALLLLLDDYYTWQRGGNSVFGEQWQKLSDMLNTEEARKSIELLNDVLSTTWNLATDILASAADLVKFANDIGLIQKPFELLNDVLTTGRDLLREILDIINLLTGNTDNISEDSLIGANVVKNENGEVDIWGTAGKAVQSTMGFQPDIGTDLLNFTSSFGQYFRDVGSKNNIGGFFNLISSLFSGNSDANEQAVSSYTNSTTTADNRTFEQNNNIQVTMQSGEDARDTAKKIANELAQQHSNYDPFK